MSLKKFAFGIIALNNYLISLFLLTTIQFRFLEIMETIKKPQVS